MQLVFNVTDEDDAERYLRVRDELSGEMRTWVAERFDDREGERAATAETFMSWKVNADDGDLADVTVAAAREFLLEWCPRKVSVAPEEARHLCRGLSAYVEFMNASGRLRGGVDRAAEVMAAIADLEDAAVAAMGDRSKYGIGKSLLSAPLEAGDGSPLPDLTALLDLDTVDLADLQQILDERTDAFNALPFEERKALTDGAFESGPPRVQLDWTLVAPSLAEVETSLERNAPLVSMVLGLVEWLGEAGRPTTKKGNFKLVDARHLVGRLATGDEVDPELPWGQESTRSSEELRILTLVADLARECGAVEQVGPRLMAVAEWSQLPLVERATSIVETLLELGPLTLTSRSHGVFFEIDQLLDDGVAHWMTGVLPAGEERELDEVVGSAEMVVDQSFPGARSQWASVWDHMVHDNVHRLLGLLELAGLVEIEGREEVSGAYGSLRTVGGVFRATPFARHVMPRFVHDAGYDMTVIADPAAATAAEVAAAVVGGDLSGAEVAAVWWTDRSVGERADALAEVAAEATPGTRMAVFAILEELGDAPAAGPAVRRLLDTPASAHAALFLIDRGLASDDELGGFVTIGPLVDALSELIDAPGPLAQQFDEADAALGGTLLEDLWRHDQPETLDVLLALGRHLPDKRRAKAARTAANKHRSWIANRRR